MAGEVGNPPSGPSDTAPGNGSWGSVGPGSGTGTGVASSCQSVFATTSVPASWMIASATASGSYSGTITAVAGALVTPSAATAPTAAITAILARRRPADVRSS